MNVKETGYDKAGEMKQEVYSEDEIMHIEMSN